MPGKRDKKPAGYGYFALVLTVLIAAVAFRIADPSPIAQLRLIVFDSYQKISPRPYDPDTPVRIIDIDEESLRRVGQWPWPRTKIAEMIDRLTQLNTAAIAFDVVFAEPDRLSPREVMKQIPKSQLPDTVWQTLEALPSNDTTLAEAVSRSRVILGFVLTNDTGTELPVSIGKFAQAGDDPRQFVPSYTGAAGNLAELQANARGLGALNWVPELDAVVRRVPILLRGGDTLYPSLSAETLRVAQGETTHVVKASGASGEFSFGQQTGVVAVKIGQFIVPTDKTGQVWVHFSEPTDARTIPAWKVLSGDATADQLAGRIVLVGASAAGLFDLQTTPLETGVPGVQAHAQAIESIFAGDLLLRPDYALGLELAYLIVAAIFLILLMRRIPVHWSVIAFFACIIMVNAGSWYAFKEWKWLLDPVYPSIALFVVFVAGEVQLLVATERERRYITGAFGRYLSPDLVARLSDEHEGLELGGEIRNMTLLFCDVRDFTKISEGLSAGELTALINRFLTPMTEAILVRQGTIDKYMGDAIMAFWNAPLDDPDHAQHACDAAVDMIARLAELNTVLKAEADEGGRTFTPLNIGIGINTGEACVGNMGSAHRFDYSVIGDNVNVASRLEGQSKTYAVQIVIGEATAETLDQWPTLELDLIKVKGKAKAERVFTILPQPSDDQAYDPGRLQKQHATLLEAYREKHWDTALELLAQCRTLAPQAALGYYDVLDARIDHYRGAPPPADWDGTYEAETK